MKLTTLATTALVLFTAPALADGHAGKMGYGLAENGSKLVMFPGFGASGETVSLTGGTLDAIAYRPVTGTLIGFSKSGKVYEIDTATGALSDTGAGFAPEVVMGADAAVAFDFNNKLDAVRAVSSDGVNVVYFPTDFAGDKANKVLRFTDPFYAEGDVNAGATPMIFANAYTNAVNGAKQEGTFQYAIDAATDSLVSLANNAGELKTIGKLTLDGKEVDVSAMGGFDILSAETDANDAVALLSMEGAEAAGLYSVDSETGALTLMADTGMTGFTSFAASLAN